MMNIAMDAKTLTYVVTCDSEGEFDKFRRLLRTLVDTASLFDGNDKLLDDTSLLTIMKQM